MGSGFPGSSGASRRGGPASGLKTEGRTALCKKNHKVVGIVSGFEKKIRWVLLPSHVIQLSYWRLKEVRRGTTK